MNKNVINIPRRQRLLELGPLYTLKELFDRCGRLYGEKNIVCEKHEGKLVYKSSVDIQNNYRSLGAALCEMGLSGANIAVIGENSYNWIIAYAAISCCTGTVVPLDKELPDADIIRLLELSNCSAVFCTKTYLKAISKAMETLENLDTCILMDSKTDSESFLYIEDLYKIGTEILSDPNLYKNEHTILPDDPAAILFTSGTTGANKGVILTHRNITSNINDILMTISDEPASISILPMNHAFEFNCHILPALYAGMMICINSSLRYMMSDLKLYRPYMTVVVPLFLDAIYKAIMDNIEANGLKTKVRHGIFLSKLLSFIKIDARRSIFRQIFDNFGGNLRYIVCGGAPVNPEVVRRLNEIGFDIIIGYGMTECSPIISINRDTYHDPHSVGKPVISTQIMISAPDSAGIGEVLIRGDKIASGYYNDSESYNQSFSDGWFMTGDYGRIDRHGNLHITGRKKSLIILDNGKNVYPEELESYLSGKLPYIKEIVVHSVPSAHGRNAGYIAATMWLDRENYFRDKEPSEIDLIVKTDLRELNKLLSQYKQLRYVYFSNDEFPKTATQKIIRDNAVNNIKKYRRIKL